MPKIKKKTPKDQVKGQAKNFITRTQAVRKLQISLPDFRRLCIFKGIYPREPRNKRKASKTSTPATTFYYTRDIQYLLHEPLLQKFREHKALGKKIAKALGRGEIGDATRLEKTQKPRARLDHIIKERYPTFVDALRDLDDALSLLYLFASLPSTSTVPTRTIARCQRLCLEFEHFLIATHAVRKTFLSIKGIYYQATVQGQDILWVTPYKFVQQITADVDLRIMGTFIEFYTTLLGFVNYRLYTSIGLAYPPRFDALSSERGGELGAITLQSREADASSKQLQNGTAANAELIADSEAATARAEAAVKAIEAAADQSQDPAAATIDVANGEPEEPEERSNAVDTFTTVAPGGHTLAQPTESSTENAHLFAPHTFYLSRETPRAPLEFLLKAFGCKRVGWPSLLGDGAFTTDENDSRITHQIVDRPPPPVDLQASTGPNAAPGSMRMPGRIYVQPQWVWDCINECRLLRPDLYAPGATLPPHLSPWANPTRGAYDPTVPLEAEPGEDGEDGETVPALEQDDWAGDAEEEDEELADEDDLELDEEDGEPDQEEEDDWSGFDSENETQPQPVKPAASDAKAKAIRKQKQAAQAEEEELERRKGMMPKRKRKLYEKMAYGNNKRSEEAEKLREKRRKIEKERSQVRAGIAR